MTLRSLLIVSILTVTASFSPASAFESSVDVESLSAKKSTPLGLYLTPADAHRALEENPDIVFIDVRDPIEVNFVGHANAVDAIVPIKTATHAFNAKSGTYKMSKNANFVADVNRIMARENATSNDPVFVMCRSGARSAAAAKLLIKAGYTNVWNLTEGFEGDRAKVTGHRDQNGWRNAGLPWSYKLDPNQAWQPAAK